MHATNSKYLDIMQVELLKNRFGFDDAFNYKKEPDFNNALRRSDILCDPLYS